MAAQILLADVGGTNARFAMVAAGSLELTHVRQLKGHDHATFEAAIAAYLSLLPSEAARPQGACLAIAAPIEGDRITMTNLSWSFSVNALQESLGLQTLLVVNDFKAIARAIPELATSKLEQIGGGTINAAAPAVVLGPGTGLGVSSLIQSGERIIAIQTEGGHIGFAPSDPLEIRILEHLWSRFDRVSVERLVSGPGLVNLYEALAFINQRGMQSLSPAQISERALSGACPDCAEALSRFFGILGSVAGDLALAMGAEGGVYIAGGIVPRMLDAFRASGFRSRFESKGRFSQYVANMASFVVTEPLPGLYGCAALFNDSLPQSART